MPNQFTTYLPVVRQVKLEYMRKITINTRNSVGLQLLWPHIPLTHWDRDKMADIFQTTFSNAFSWKNLVEFRLKFNWTNWCQPSIGLDNGLAPYRRWSIIWTNNGLDFWRIDASLGLDELSTTSQLILVQIFIPISPYYWPLVSHQYWSRWRHMMSAMASQITSLTMVNSTVYSGADQRKHQSSASLAFVRGIHRWPVNSPH